MYIPVLALGVVVQLALDHVDHDLVADEATLVHDFLGFLSKIGLLRDLRAQHVSGGLFRTYSSAIEFMLCSEKLQLTRWHAQYFSFRLGAWVPLPGKSLIPYPPASYDSIAYLHQGDPSE